MKRSIVDLIISAVDCLVAIVYQISAMLQADAARGEKDHIFAMLFLLFSVIFLFLSRRHRGLEDAASKG